MPDHKPQVIQPTAAAWDAFVLAHPRAHPLQLSAWGTLKGAFGWHTQRVALTQRDQIVAGAQLLFRRLPLRLGKLAYLPFGGYVSDATQWPALWDAVKQVAKRKGAAFLKWEPGLYLQDPLPDVAQWRFKVSPQTIQPPRTIVLDISDDDEAILARMNQGTRRKIRKSLKSDIHYYEARADDVATFTRLMNTTGDRKDFGVHDPAYYRMAYELFVPQHAALILAEHEGEPLAGVMVFAAGDTAQYLYGASSNNKRNLAAGYGVQWQAIRWAKARGCRYYDMWGVPDADAETLEAHFQERSDGLWGPYGMKRGFGGQVVRSAGAWDVVYNQVVYNAYTIALRIRS